MIFYLAFSKKNMGINTSNTHTQNSYSKQHGKSNIFILINNEMLKNILCLKAVYILIGIIDE